MRVFTRWAFGLGLAIVSTGLIVATARATCHDEPQDHGCSLATLNGFYVAEADGLDVPTNTKFVNAGYEVYRGDGTMIGVYSISVEGAIQRRIRYTGTYTVNPDCSGTLTTHDEGTNVYLHYDQFVMPSGHEFSYVQTDEGSLSGGFERRSE